MSFVIASSSFAHRGGIPRKYTCEGALDTVLPDLGRPTKAALEKAMRGHILAQAELIGTYQKGD